MLALLLHLRPGSYSHSASKCFTQVKEAWHSWTGQDRTHGALCNPRLHCRVLGHEDREGEEPLYSLWWFVYSSLRAHSRSRRYYSFSPTTPWHRTKHTILDNFHWLLEGCRSEELTRGNSSYLTLPLYPADLYLVFPDAQATSKDRLPANQQNAIGYM